MRHRLAATRWISDGEFTEKAGRGARVSLARKGRCGLSHAHHCALGVLRTFSTARAVMDPDAKSPPAAISGGRHHILWPMGRSPLPLGFPEIYLGYSSNH